jgi:hypothetical protein
MGNAPAMGTDVFANAASGFTVYYFNGKTGFTSPMWLGYPAVNMGAASPTAIWLLAKGLPHDADLQDDPNHDGVNLLMAYALNLDPNQNLSGSMPNPVCAAGQMRLTFHAGSADVTYTVESSTDLKVWSTDGVTLSAMDAGNCRTASVNMDASTRFMRLVVSNVATLSPIDTWLLANGYPAGSDLQADPNHDGVNLLLAYALNLDPNRNLSGSMPKPVCAAGQMRLTFHAGSAGVTYTVESSTDLKVWSAESAPPDANGFRTATVPMTAPSRFMRIVVTY